MRKYKMESCGMSDPRRIVFVDCDGPLISTGCYGVTPAASNLRACMNQSAIGYLNMLCDHAKAKVVTNTSHNYHEVKDGYGFPRDLKTDLIRWGVKDHLFHEDWRTKFPECGKFSGGEMNRLLAIEEWLAKNGDADWCCFDDAKFTEDKRLILIDFDHGITRDSIMRACGVFGISHIMVY
jgi:hypothetical protein